MRLPSGITIPDDPRQSLRKTVTPLNLHVVGVAVLSLLVLYFGVRLLLLSGSTGTQGDEAIVAAQSRVAAAESGARPLRGLDGKLQVSDAEADRFYSDRLPFADSDVAAQLGILAKRTNVRLSRASYVHAAPSDGVIEVRIDASVTGEYRSLAQFINALERDRSFFLIQNLILSGAQNGLVNLQMRLGTYIREPMPAVAAAQNGAKP